MAWNPESTTVLDSLTRGKHWLNVYIYALQNSLEALVPAVCIGNSMICSDIGHKFHEWYFEIAIRSNWDNFEISRVIFMQISRTNHGRICLYYYPQKLIVIFTRRYFKLSWNTTAVSQSNSRNFSCSSIFSQVDRKQAKFLTFQPLNRWPTSIFF